MWSRVAIGAGFVSTVGYRDIVPCHMGEGIAFWMMPPQFTSELPGSNDAIDG